MVAPYLTSTILQQQPAGLAWNVVPTLTADQAAQAAQLDFACQQVTSLIDGYLHQSLRAMVVTEQGQWPGQPRVSVDRHTGIGQVVTRQWPVTAVNAVQVSPARAFPPCWTAVPLDHARIRTPVLQPASGQPATGPSGGNVIDIAPGHIGGGTGYGRGLGGGAQLVLTSYTSGYPHALLSADATVAQGGTQQVLVDDVTGWPGWAGWLLDGTQTEWVSVTAATATTPVQLPGVGGTVNAGPGMLTLAAPLASPHPAGALLTAMPLAVLNAAALSCAVLALEAIAAIAVQSSGGQLPGGLGWLAFESERALDPFMRVM